MIPTALTIGTYKSKLLKTGKKARVKVNTESPNILIVGEAGTGKTFLCEEITLLNPDTSFVYLGRRETIVELPYRREFSAVPPENFFEHNPVHDGGDACRAGYLAILDAAVEKAVATKSVLIIEELSLYLWADADHLGRAVDRLVSEGVPVIFSNQVVPGPAHFDTLNVGTVLLPGRDAKKNEPGDLESRVKDTSGRRSGNDLQSRAKIIYKYASTKEIGAMTLVTPGKITGGLTVPSEA